MTEESDQKKTLIIDLYRQIVEQTSRLPTHADFLDNNISQSVIRGAFGNITKLHLLIENDFPEILSDNMAHESQIFSSKKTEELHENLKKYKKFVITSVVNEKPVHIPFYNSIKSYCDKNDALLLLIACSDVASTKSPLRGWTFDSILKNETFISQETQLNSRFYIANLLVSAKQIKPLTGLARHGENKSSWVYASPKQFLEIIPTSVNIDRSPKAIMTPGAITMPNYENDKYMSQRTSYIAERDHVMGALIIEIEDDKKFHYRPVQANAAGEFVDFGLRYFPDGTTSSESCTLVLGDWHSGSTAPEVIASLPQLIEDANVKDIVVHDIFDGKSVNHHILNQPLKLAKRAMDGEDNLEEELIQVGNDINMFHNLIDGTLVVVKSNHDEWLERYLNEGSYTKDSTNHRLCLELAIAYLDGEMPLKFGVENYGYVEEPDRVLWLDRNDEHKIANMELGQHGDMGTAGKPATLESIEKDVGCAVVGHIHSPAIMRGVFRVGTSTSLQLDYNKKGASSWMHTHALVANDGSVQLINLIGGKYRL